MRASLTVLTEELRRLKSSGLKTVSVPAASLARLEAAIRGLGPASSASEPAEERPSDRPTRPATGAKAAVVATAAVVGMPPPLPVELPPGDKAARWAWLKQHVLTHPTCRENVRPGKQVVLGVGSLDAKIFFCGEAPGAEEEIKGEPFVGPAGDLLTRMIGAMGLRREEVYMGNIMNWRPQLPTASGGEQLGNRPPTTDEMAFCLPFLRAQLEIVQPEVIVALGATAAKGLLGPESFKSLGEIRGKWHAFNGVPVRATYHPSFILRNNTNRSKRAIWEDLLEVMERVALPVSTKQRGYFA